MYLLKVGAFRYNKDFFFINFCALFFCLSFFEISAKKNVPEFGNRLSSCT